MAFYLLTRDRTSGAVGLLSDRVFADRDEALDALREIVGSGKAPDADKATVLLADLDAAQPVLVMPVAQAATAEAADGDADVPEPTKPAAEVSRNVEPPVSATPLDAPFAEPSAWARVSRPGIRDRVNAAQPADPIPASDTPEPRSDPEGDVAPWWNAVPATGEVVEADGHVDSPEPVEEERPWAESMAQSEADQPAEEPKPAPAGKVGEVVENAADEAAEAAGAGMAPMTTVDESFAWAVADTAAGESPSLPSTLPAPLPAPADTPAATPAEKAPAPPGPAVSVLPAPPAPPAPLLDPLATPFASSPKPVEAEVAAPSGGDAAAEQTEGDQAPDGGQPRPFVTRWPWQRRKEGSGGEAGKAPSAVPAPARSSAPPRLPPAPSGLPQAPAAPPAAAVPIAAASAVAGADGPPDIDAPSSPEPAKAPVPDPVVTPPAPPARQPVAADGVEAPDVPGAPTPRVVAPERAVIEDDASETPPEPAKAYQPGHVSLDEYTCEDCVYVDTCPKKEESTPADCGLFQWRS